MLWIHVPGSALYISQGPTSVSSGRCSRGSACYHKRCLHLFFCNHAHVPPLWLAMLTGHHQRPPPDAALQFDVRHHASSPRPPSLQGRVFALIWVGLSTVFAPGPITFRQTPRRPHAPHTDAPPFTSLQHAQICKVRPEAQAHASHHGMASARHRNMHKHTTSLRTVR